MQDFQIVKDHAGLYSEEPTIERVLENAMNQPKDHVMSRGFTTRTEPKICPLFRPSV